METRNRLGSCRIAGLAALILSGLGLTAPSARAQTPPPTAVAQATLTPREDPDKSNWTIALGGTLNTGNTRTFALSANTHLQLKRHAHQLTADVTGIYGLAAVRDATTNVFGGWDPNAGNIFGQLRYDFFMTTDDALVIAVQGRHDRFAGLEGRVQGQVGYLRNFVDEEKHRLWAEAGYDLSTWTKRPGRPTIDVSTERGHSPKIEARVPQAVRTDLARFAAEEGMTVSQVLRRLVEQYVAEHRAPERS